jgi:hypothetical protein
MDRDAAAWDGAESKAGKLFAELAKVLESTGFDLVQPLQVGWYNALVQGALKLEDFGSPSHLAVIIGNTGALWPHFIAALEAEPALLESAHPLQIYTERTIGHAVAQLGLPASLRWSHAAGPGLVAMQRLAQAAGLAYLSESHLSVHPKYGPWIALRAACSFPLRGPPGSAPVLAHPCGSCAEHCRPAFERARGAIRGSLTESELENQWQLWLAVRDACPTGRAYRYGEVQIRYHYLKDREELRRACRPARGV